MPGPDAGRRCRRWIAPSSRRLRRGRGAYVLADAADGKPDVILIGTGSEVSLCVEAYEQLARDGVPPRVVSMPSWELFEAQDEAYRDSVLPPTSRRASSVEAGVDLRLGPLRRARPAR